MSLQMTQFHSSLWLSNIPLHHVFTHSCVDGHLGCFYVLAIVNSAAVNIGVYVSFGIRVVSGYICLVVRLPGHMVVLFLVESRKMVQMNLFAGQEERCGYRGRMCVHGGGGEGGTNWESRIDTYAHT